MKNKSRVILSAIILSLISGMMTGCGSDGKTENSTPETTVAVTTETPNTTESATTKPQPTTAKVTSAVKTDTKNNSKDNSKSEKSEKSEKKSESKSAKKSESKSTSSEKSVFEMMPSKFIFSSGAGNWRTNLNVKKDGSFTGQFTDSDMGDTGEDNPYGVTYISDFSGKFSSPDKIDKYTYSMELKSLDIANNEGDFYYENGVKYVYSKPSGMENASSFKIYSPGMKVTDLPKEVIAWCPPEVAQSDTLTYYVIYNEGGRSSFVSVQD